MPTPKPTHRWFHVTPDRLIVGLLAVEGLLYLSERLGWLAKGWPVLIAVAAVGVAMLLMVLCFVMALMFRWRFQFSIRSLLVLAVVVALPCSWLAAEMKEAKRQKEAVDKIEKLGGSVEYDWQGDVIHLPRPNAQPPGPAWVRNVVGDDFLTVVVSVDLDDTQTTDAALEVIEGLPQVLELGLSKTKVTDSGLEHIRGLHELRMLFLFRTEVTDLGVRRLRGSLHTCKIYH